jgi:hypothetical protein
MNSWIPKIVLTILPCIGSMVIGSNFCSDPQNDEWHDVRIFLIK